MGNGRREKMDRLEGTGTGVRWKRERREGEGSERR